MTEWGIADNANFSESMLTSTDAHKLSFPIRRTLVLPELTRQLQVINSARRLKEDFGVKTLIVYTTQSSRTAFLDFDGYCAKLEEFLNLADGNIYGVEIHNELDTPDWGISDDEIVEIAKRGADVVHNHGLKAFAPSLLSGPEEGRFEYIAQRIHTDVDFMSVHPYYCSIGGMPWPEWHYGTVEHKADICAELCPWIPTAFTELGCTVGYDGITQYQQARFVQSVKEFQHPSIAFIIYFCRDDMMVPGAELAEGKCWGLIDGSNEPRMSYKVLEIDVADEYEFVLGFKEWAELEPELIGSPEENEHGGIDGLSQQLTSTGLLTWANLVDIGGVRTFYEAATKTRYALYDGATESVVI